MGDKEEQWDKCLRAMGARIHRARVARGMDVPALARASGLTETECRRLEDGSDHDPDLLSVVAIARTLGTSVDGLLPGRWPPLGRGGASPE